MKQSFIDGKCTKLNEFGYGVVSNNGKTILVKNMLPGENGKLVMSNFDKFNTYATVSSLSTKSSNRVEAKCKYATNCGGCQIQCMSDISQADFKTLRVKEEFTKHKITADIKPIISDDNPWFYRNKVVMIPAFNKKKEVIFGFNEFNSNQLFDVEECLTQNDISNKIMMKIRELVTKYKVMPYDKQTKRGTLRYILLKYGFTSNEVMVVFVTNGKDFRFKKEFVKVLTTSFKEIKTIIQNINTRSDNLVLAKDEVLWFGNGYIKDKMFDLTFNISSKSFYQINPKQCEKLYATALDFAELTGNEIVLDAYCGIGTISLMLSKKAKHVIGVELIQDAIKDAKENARINKIRNTEFYVGDAPKFIIDMAKHKEKIDVIVVDPPRSGCTNELLDAVNLINPQKFVYVSCDVSTQARDIAYLNKKGWQVTKCQPVDMFPHTFHVENVVLMTKHK